MSAAASLTPMTATTQIAEAVRAVLGHVYKLRLRAIVLTGSLARDEGTWSCYKGWVRLIGDAEFLIVFDDGASFPSSERLPELKREIETRLRANAIDAEIGLSPVRPGYLRSLRPHIFAYELLEHGKVIWGDTRVLDLAPRFSASDIPLEDAFHLLMNRLIELLEAVCEADQIEPLTETARYRAAKLLLDMATSFLVFQRQYESTYLGRAARLLALAATAACVPIPLNRFAEQVRLTTKYKLGESQWLPITTADDLLVLIEDVHSLWAWELERLTDADAGTSDDELIKRWLAKQDRVQRIRGWASLAKRHGMLASVKSLPRWINQAPKGSPRRLIYASASEQFFALSALLASDERDDGVWRQSYQQLPVTGDSRALSSWRDAAKVVAWNYHHFLESTRS